MVSKFGLSNNTAKINFIKETRKACKNFSSIALNVIRNNFPISVTFQDGVQMNVANLHDLVFLSRHDAWKHCQINGDELQVSFDGTIVKFSDWRHNGDIPRIFLKEDYKLIPVKDSIVVDVGANIGDSSIYFALRGAKLVIAIEPVLSNFENMKNNVKLNELNNIKFKNVGISGKKQKIRIDADNASNGSMIVSDNGDDVSMVTLEDIVNENHIESGILKLDCEGYEHEIIIATTPDVLSKFNYIYAELHYDAIEPINEIKEKLTASGFDVSFSYLISPTIPQFLLAKQS